MTLISITYRLAFTFITITTCTVLLAYEYKPNGPPLYVCAGAVPLEPNTDKLPHDDFDITEYEGKEPKVIVATSKEKFDEGFALLTKDNKIEYDNTQLHVFYLHGNVPEREAKGNGVGKYPAIIECQVFGIERTYIKGRNIDEVIIHIVAKDTGANKSMAKCNPGFYYKIPFNKLDTEHDGTPSITEHTNYVINVMQVSSTTL